ncbi:MAG: hypothetical protein A2798_02230 [Candidatus Levybacteria bacterium RIFCSPHIGHO2_01_FULL_37_17]|nr:MAG: hypothetical protein A2798_02230 [Candidatus Levybacteria bacterium RIFCSPHIGHO2_01_FULL_37_17]OGH36696.1 MAG: hypothetical protein A2959_00220 [Candidatus Levybacteria bacterium RIFCSPLOWO2_01_FULL_38_23]
MGYTRDTLRGVSWMSALRLATRAASFLKIAVLARFLSPAQFGLFGVASIALSLLEVLTQTGINIFLVQSKKEIEEYVDSAWVVSILRGAFIGLLIILLSPFLAEFFNTPEALNILLLISIVPFIKGFINPSEIKFQKNLNFAYEFWFRSIIFVVDAAIAIIFSVLTQSVYGLVLGLIAGAVLEVVLSFAIIKPWPRFNVNFSHVREILHRGKWVTAYSVFDYFGENLDDILVGRVLGTPVLGIYQVAYRISTMPISEIANVVSPVVFPVYARIVEDNKRLIRAFLKTSFLTALAAVVMGTIIFVYPREIVLIVLGEQWLSAIPVLQLLSIYGVLRAIVSPSYAVFLAKGEQKHVTLVILVRLLALSLFIYPFIKTFGLVGAGYAAIFSIIAEIPFVIYFLLFTFKNK